jgi:hypothetical protein
MFFPATQGDEIVLEPKEAFEISSSETRKYLEKSTIIMCNPNALIY